MFVLLITSSLPVDLKNSEAVRYDRCFSAWLCRPSEGAAGGPGSTWPLETVGVPAELPWWWLSANYYVREAFALIKTLIFD